MNKPIFKGFRDAQDVYKQFDQKPGGERILFAVYDIDGYEGSAFVLYRWDNKLYTVQGGHCSCYGLEGQWHPVEVTKKSLLHEINHGNLGKPHRYTYDIDGDGSFADELKALLEAL